MSYDELNDSQKLQAKQQYLIGLADRGVFIKTIYGENAGPERDPSLGELNWADKLVSDDTMRQQCVSYVPEDFEISETHLNDDVSGMDGGRYSHNHGYLRRSVNRALRELDIGGANKKQKDFRALRKYFEISEKHHAL